MHTGFQKGSGKNREAGQSVARVQEFWGKSAPEWVLVLAQKCDESSQNAVAEAMGYSPAVVSATLKQRYTGDLRRVEARVKAMYIRADVGCPVMGLITGTQCSNYQQRKVTGASSIFSRLRGACGSCRYREEA